MDSARQLYLLLQDPSLAFFTVPLFCIAFAHYNYHIITRASPGISRLALVLPSGLVLFAVLQSLWDLYFMLTFLFLGISFSKSLSLCLNRGPLKRDIKFWRFFAILIFPIVASPMQQGPSRHSTKPRHKQKGRGLESWDAASNTLLRSFVKSGGYVFLQGVLAFPSLPLHVQEGLYVASLYLALSGLMDLFDGVAQGGFGVETSPAFDHPWLSSSISEFWGRRWNAPAALCFRWLLYEPLTEGRLVYQPNTPRPPPSPARRALASILIYLASGALHELTYWLNTRSLPPYHGWLIFFSLQPLLVYAQPWAQEKLLGICPERARKHVSRCLTLALLGAVAHGLWFPSCHASKTSCFLVPEF